MTKIKLLDCTLRDGGYVNDWRFGESAIKDISRLILNSGVDIFEIGFLRNEPYNSGRVVFNSMEQITSVITPKKKTTLYAAMIEATVDPFPFSLLENRDGEDGETIDVIRAMIWKRLLREGFDYCKKVAEKGYRLCVQPVRVDQYSREEFIAMIELFNELHPLAVYVVDSWGLQDKKSLMRYIEWADSHLDPDIALGYHGHNNLLQVYGIACDLAERGLERELIIDASVYGIGRGAGNLNIELFAKYLNENHGADFRLSCFWDVYEKHLKLLYQKSPWGYSLPLYLTALHHCNPEYGVYYGFDKRLDALSIDSVLGKLLPDDKIRFSPETAGRYLAES